jgi:hypothetical protein
MDVNTNSVRPDKLANIIPELEKIVELGVDFGTFIVADLRSNSAHVTISALGGSFTEHDIKTVGGEFVPPISDPHLSSVANLMAGIVISNSAFVSTTNQEVVCIAL